MYRRYSDMAMSYTHPPTNFDEETKHGRSEQEKAVRQVTVS